MSLQEEGKAQSVGRRGKSDPKSEQERIALTAFWERLVAANSELGEDARAEHVTEDLQDGECQSEQSLRGSKSSLHYRLIVYDNGTSLTEVWEHANGETTYVRYDETDGLNVKTSFIPDSSCRPVCLVYGIKDRDVDAILKDLSTGRPPLEHIVKRCIREYGRAQSAKCRPKGFLEKLFERPGRRKDA